MVGITLVLPFSPFALAFGFSRIPALFVAAMTVIVAMYVAGAELAKRWFYRRVRL